MGRGEQRDDSNLLVGPIPNELAQIRHYFRVYLSCSTYKYVLADPSSQRNVLVDLFYLIAILAQTCHPSKYL